MTALLLYVEALQPEEGFLLYLSLKERDDVKHQKDQIKSSLWGQKEGEQSNVGDVQLTLSLLEHL